MFYLFNLLIVFISLQLVNCLDCPKYGTKGKKVPDILKLMDDQNGYYSTVEVNNKDRENLVHEYFNVDHKLGFIDLEAMNQNEMNRRYYYHETNEKIVIRKNTCTRLDLTHTEKVESIKDWFEPADIVENSEIFKDFLHFGPSALMIYANSISDKASFIGTELIDGRSIDHWFYCIAGDGPYIDFYFDALTSYPYRFSLFFPQTELNENNETIILDDNRYSDYVYNFFNFKPLFISEHEPLPYPISYGCTQKDSPWKTSLPDFTSIAKFSLDMEAIITYPTGEIIKSTARVMKHNDIYSYEITEQEGTVRSIENPPPLGRWEVDEYSGKCKYFTSDYRNGITLVTRWPFYTDRGFNLLYYIVMKPDSIHSPSFIGTIDLGPVKIEEYRANNFFVNQIDAIVDYHYPVLNNSIDPNNIPSKIVFTKDRSPTYYYYGDDDSIPSSVEVTIFDFKDSYFDVEDRFDVSGCYENLGTYTWFQMVFSDPWSSSSNNDYLVREDIHNFLTNFIPITRISDIIVDNINSNVYVTVKLLDRIHFIDAYEVNEGYKISYADRNVKYWRVEDCEEACTSNPACTRFSYCSDFSCDFLAEAHLGYLSDSAANCSQYSIKAKADAQFIRKNFLSPMRYVLHEIRQKISQNLLYLSSLGSTAEELFVVNGPEEIGDLSEEDFKEFGGALRFLRGDEYPIIQIARKFSSGIATEIKVEQTECLKLCSNDDACNSISYCPNQNKECILSTETEFTLKTSLDEATTKADGCAIYEKSFMNYFTKYPGKSLVVDAASVKEGVDVTDCAKQCINSKDFNCESFDYCSSRSLNDSVCFLHVNHITADSTHEVNGSNWKFAQNGCDHFSKKSDHDYRHIVGHRFSSVTEVIDTHEEIPLEDCAGRCNSNPHNCYTFEYCEIIEQIDHELDEFDFGVWATESTWTKTTCRLSNVKPSSTSNTNDGEFQKYFDKSLSSNEICSVYVNQEKIHKKSTETYHDKLNGSFGSKDRTSLAFGLGSFFFILAFGVGVLGFTFAIKKNYLYL